MPLVGTNPTLNRLFDLDHGRSHRQGHLILIRGLLDGPVVVGNSTLIPHYELETEDAVEEILMHTAMNIHHNQPLL
jgi:hypothetical protein